MASPSSQDWLELGLGFKSTKKQQDENEKKLATSSHPLAGYDSDEEEEEGLDLRLQIGPKNNENENNININMGNGMALMHQKQQKWRFQMDSISNIRHFHGLSSAPNSGLWFSLRSSANRKSGPALPQIPKAYIRVKDENMTVLMVKKYLVTKLSLSNEAEVELWCMGERLVHTQSLKEVRDGVWLPKLVEFLNYSNSSFSTSIFHHCSHHHQNQTPSHFQLMSLHYGRTCLF